MSNRTIVFIAILVVNVLTQGCQSAPKRTVLAAPAGTNAAAGRHNDEGMQAYQQQQWESAKQHFEAAIAATPELAEAHYNLGMVLYRLGALRDGDAHFIKAANLAPGNKVIWNAPPFSNVAVPEKEVTMPGSDGHMHSR